MSELFTNVARLASGQHGGLHTRQLDALGVDRHLRPKWVARGLLARAGPRAYVVTASPPSWLREVWIAAANADGYGYVAGRTAARLHRLDGFTGGELEVLVGRQHRGVRLPYTTRTTCRPLGIRDTVVIHGVRCLNTERLILESPKFDFTAAETENAIDSAIRARKVRERRLREHVLAVAGPGVTGATLRGARRHGW